MRMKLPLMLAVLLTCLNVFAQDIDRGKISVVVFNEKNELNARTRRIQVLGLRYQSTIQLIKALGGGWDQSVQKNQCD